MAHSFHRWWVQDVPLYAQRFTGGNGLITLNLVRLS